MPAAYPVFHLDANGLVAISNARSPLAHRVAQALAAGVEIHTSAIAWAEFLSGPPSGLSAIEDQAARGTVSLIIPLSEVDAELAARLFNATGRRSRTLADCMIAACAIRSKSPLATEDQADFAPFLAHGLTLA